MNKNELRELISSMEPIKKGMKQIESRSELRELISSIESLSYDYVLEIAMDSPSNAADFLFNYESEYWEISANNALGWRDDSDVGVDAPDYIWPIDKFMEYAREQYNNYVSEVNPVTTAVCTEMIKDANLRKEAISFSEYVEKLYDDIFYNEADMDASVAKQMAQQKAADNILMGFRDGEEALEYAEGFDEGISTPEGYPLDSGAIGEAVNIKWGSKKTSKGRG